MIGSLRGTLLERLPAGEVLVEVAGVGYRVTMAPTAAVELGNVGDNVFVHVHHYIRDDTQSLYGFCSRDERTCFEALLSAHGVGPALALAILSVHGPVALQRVLADDDVAALCLVPGVGKKTAQRLLVELKSKLEVPEFDDLPVAGQVAATSVRADVRDALVGLGYSPDEIRDVLRDVPDDGDPALLLREALQRLAVVP